MFKRASIRWIAVLCISLLIFSSIVVSAEEDSQILRSMEVLVANAAELQEAILTAPDGKMQVIKITQDISLADKIVVPSGKWIELGSAEAQLEISRKEDNLSSPFFEIQAAGKLSLSGEAPLVLDSKGVETAIESAGVFITCYGELELLGGEIRNGNNGREGQSAYSAMIYLSGQEASFKMRGGKIHNNYNNPIPNGISMNSGGVFLSSGASFTMEGGAIDSNIGVVGGVHLGDIFYDSERAIINKFYLKNGLDSSGNITVPQISNNQGLGTSAQPGRSFTGGGVQVFTNSEFIMDGGIITANLCNNNGGGIGISDQYVSDYNYITDVQTHPQEYSEYSKYAPARFIMNGGEISNNQAMNSSSYANQGGNGGGIFVASSNVEINAGRIINNEANNMGGGIYCAIIPYTLALKDVVICENRAIEKAVIHHYSNGCGGGIWHCSIGSQMIFQDQGFLLFDNYAQLEGADLFAHKREVGYLLNGKNVAGDFTVKLPAFDLNSEAILWYWDRAGKRHLSGQAGERLFDLKQQDGSLMLVAENAYTDSDKISFIENAKLLIRANVAGKGGGIGTNANLIIGNSKKEKFKDIKILKSWLSAGAEKISKVRIVIFIDGEPYTSAILSNESQNEQTHVFKNIPYAYIDENGLEQEYKLEIKEFDLAGNEINNFEEERIPSGSPEILQIQRIRSEERDSNGQLKEAFEWYPYYYSEFAMEEFKAWRYVNNGGPGIDNSIKLHCSFNGEDYGIYELRDSTDWHTNIPLPIKSETVNFIYAENISDYWSVDFDLEITGDESALTVKLPKLQWNVDPATGDLIKNLGFVPELIPEIEPSKDESYKINNFLKPRLKILKDWEDVPENNRQAVTISLYEISTNEDGAITRRKLDTVVLSQETGWEHIFEEIDYDTSKANNRLEIREELSELDPYEVSYSELFKEVKAKFKFHWAFIESTNPYSTGLADKGLNFQFLLNGEELGQEITLKASPDFQNDFEATIQMPELKQAVKPIRIEYYKKADGSFHCYNEEQLKIEIVGDSQSGYRLRLPEFQAAGKNEDLKNILKVEPEISGEYVLRASNKLRSGSVDIVGRKEWVGGPLNHPEIQLQLYRTVLRDDPNFESTAEKVGEAVTLASGSEKLQEYRWYNLAEFNSDGYRYKYFIKELNVPDSYQASEEGLLIRNIYQEIPPAESEPPELPTSPSSPVERPRQTVPTIPKVRLKVEERLPKIPITGEARYPLAQSMLMFIALIIYQIRRRIS
ncbi:MAG: Cna B-type domain-containing protein [Eubacteriales bacterium]|nr:Cna B-type domain-containing protein [Eubacteriales bacterium]